MQLGQKLLYYKFDGSKLKDLREKYGISIKKFALIAGWSISREYQLESGKVKTVSEKIKNELIITFQRLLSSVPEILSKIFFKEISKYILNGQILREIRRSHNISAIYFAAMMGWKKSHQNYLERRKIMITEEKFLKILRGIENIK